MGGNCGREFSSPRKTLVGSTWDGAVSSDLAPPRICPNQSLEFHTLHVPSRVRPHLSDSTGRIMIVTVIAATLCACSISKNSRTIDETQTLSPRLIKVGDPVPKGGGVYKTGEPYLAGGKWYTPVDDRAYDQVGFASWYGDFFHGRRTANGEIYDMNALTAAHPTLPLPTYAIVTNLQNNRSVVVRVNDRGPYHDNRIIDLSHRAAELLGLYNHGTAPVRVRYFAPAPLNGDDSLERSILAQQPWAAHITGAAAEAGSAKNNMLSVAAMTAGKPLVVEKGNFEGRRLSGSWNTAWEPAVAANAIPSSSR